MKHQNTRFPSLRRLFSWWQRSLTPTGKIFVALLLIGMPSVLGTESGLRLLMAPIFASLLVALAIGWLFRPRLDLIAQPHIRIMRQQQTFIDCEVHNSGRLPAIGLQFRWIDEPTHWGSQPESVAIDHLGQGQSQRFTLPVIAQQRGISDWPPIEAVSRFPLQLFCFRQSFSVRGTVRVYPHYRRLRNREVIGSVLDEPVSPTAPSTRSGHSGDYLGNREYQVGLAVRRWDFRSWARLGRPIVREYTEPEVRQAAVFVDTFSDAEGPNEDFEELLSLAAAVCDTLVDDRYHITSVALGYKLMDPPLRSDRDSVSSILDQLAAVSASPPQQLENWLRHLRPAIRPGQAVILIVNGDDTNRRRFIRQFRRQVATATVVCVASRWSNHRHVPRFVQLIPNTEFSAFTAPSKAISDHPLTGVSAIFDDSRSRSTVRSSFDSSNPSP